MAQLKSASTTPKLFNLIYEANPRPLNVATPLTTRICADTPHHPFYIRARRQLASVDLSKLQLSVTASVNLSKKAFIRDAAVIRVRKSLRRELESQGWNWDGTAREASEGDGKKKRGFNLTGAYKVALVVDPIVLTSSRKTVQESCSLLVRKMAYNQSQARPLEQKSDKGQSKPLGPQKYKSSRPPRQRKDAGPL